MKITFIAFGILLLLACGGTNLIENIGDFDERLFGEILERWHATHKHTRSKENRKPIKTLFLPPTDCVCVVIPFDSSWRQSKCNKH